MRITITEEGQDLIAWAVYRNMPVGYKDKLAYDERHEAYLNDNVREWIINELKRYTPTTKLYPDLISRVTAIFH